MPFLIFTYSPKEGVSPEAFERFLEEVDQPATLALPSTVSSAIHRIVGSGAKDAPFAYVEALEITSFEAWEEDAKRPEVQKVLEAWKEYGDVENVKVYQAETIFQGSA